MSSADWEEVKRLAADFQRAQLSSSIQRLSERNCVEVIHKLAESNLIKLYHTSDGKSFITPMQLQKEVMDELYVAGGRINLVDLSKLLEVDLSVIQEEIKSLLKHQRSVHLVVGQLISADYENFLAEEINVKLFKDGTITVDELASEYELPSEFVRKLIETGLGKSIRAVQDPSSPGVFYTEQYLARLKARITGRITAITVPTPFHKLLQHNICNEKLFISTVEKLISSGRIRGEVVGNRQSKACIYIPAVYSRAQLSWATNFLQQNGYLEYDFLSRLGINDPAGYIQRHFSTSHKLLNLPGMCIGQGLLQQLDSAIEEALVTHSFVDVSIILPSSFSNDIIKNLIEISLEKRQGSNLGGKPAGRGRKISTSSSALVLGDSCVVSEVLIGNIKQQLETEMASRGQKLVAAGGFKPKANPSKSVKEDHDTSNKKDDRRKKAAGGKTGGGTQGRETKTRSTKKKGGNRRAAHDDDESDDDCGPSQNKSNTAGALRFPEVEYLPIEELTAQLSKIPQLQDADDSLLEELSLELHPWSKKVFTSICESCYSSLVSAGNTGKKKTFQQVQDKVLALLTACKLAEKGTKEFGPELEQQLAKHLLKTQCSELLSELLIYSTDDVTMQETSANDLTPEVRMQLISQLRDSSEGGYREVFMAAHKATAGSDLSAFFDAIENVFQDVGVMLHKKKDNKKDRQVLLSHRSGLLEQLSACHEPALCLHLSTLLLFHSVTGHILHASGKFVPQLVAYLKPHLPEDHNELLLEYQGLVMKKLKTNTDEESDELDKINARLEELTPQLQEKAIVFKKTSS